MRLAVSLPMVLAACGSDDQFMIVTIESVPAVHDVAKLEVVLANDGGTTRGDSFDVDNPTFPTTFSISSPPGTAGPLEIEIVARDGDDLLVGRGATSTQFEDPTATVVLDSTDFVINTDFAEDQFPSRDFESHGYQLGATASGVWTATYRDDCAAPCSMFARRFDSSGRAVDSGLAAGTNAFSVSTELSDGFFTTPTTASNGENTVVIWNFSEPTPLTGSGIACRAIDSRGNGVGEQVTILDEPLFPFAVAVTPLSNGSFAAAWQGRNALNDANVIKAAIVNAQCTPSNIVEASVVTQLGGATRAALASNGNNIMYAWTIDNAAGLPTVRLRVLDSNNAQVSTDQLVVESTPTETIEFARVTRLGAGFGIFVRWSQTSGTGPGRIELYKTSSVGMIQGSPTLITAKTASDFESAQGFSVATRPDNGTMLVAWHSCMEINDGSGCGVFGQLLDASGSLVGTDFVLPTTTTLDQTAPSVIGLPGAFAAVWSDASAQAPDVSGLSVRGRVLYPTTSGGASAKRDPSPPLFVVRGHALSTR